jgi:hypothetical protein
VSACSRQESLTLQVSALRVVSHHECVAGLELGDIDLFELNEAFAPRPRHALRRRRSRAGCDHPQWRQPVDSDEGVKAGRAASRDNGEPSDPRAGTGA